MVEHESESSSDETDSDDSSTDENIDESCGSKDHSDSVSSR